jgi:hypothetical protein
MLFPRKEEVLEIHARLLEQFGGLPGIRDEGSLDSALSTAAVVLPLCITACCWEA